MRTNGQQTAKHGTIFILQESKMIKLEPQQIEDIKGDDKVKIWNYVSTTDPSHTKEVSFGARKFTTVDAYRQIEKATTIWGVFGGEWGVKDETFTVLGLKTVLYQATLFYTTPQGTRGTTPIHSDDQLVKGQNDKYNEDWSKKLATDALTKGLSKLGFNADIFTGQFDQKYH